MASNYGVAPSTQVLPSYKDANPKYSNQWPMRHGMYQIRRSTTISASHSSKMFYKKETPNITTAYRYIPMHFCSHSCKSKTTKG
jgi:hypothetical protein